MRILLVEDDQPKQAQVSEFLATLVPDMVILVAASVNAAIALLDGESFDVVVLDMSLPTFNAGKTIYGGGRQQEFGGRQILNYLWEMEVRCPVYLITQFRDFTEEGRLVDLEEVHQRLKTTYPGLYLGYAHFQQSSDSWKEELRSLLMGTN